MSNAIHLHYEVSGEDFTRAGEASGLVKKTLKKLGYNSDAIRRVAIAMYEAEINMVIHANGGIIDVEISEAGLKIVLKDTGPGINDIIQATQAGFSTALEKIRILGFGAGLGLPNMIKNTDDIIIDSIVGVGTTITMFIGM